MTVSDERWNKIAPEEIAEVWEDYYPSPYKTSFRMVHCENGITLKLSTTEWPLRVECTSRNLEVCEDSCMEFFLTPNTTDKDYLNIEINAIGISLVGIGEGRAGRKKLNIAGTGFKIETLIHPEEGWELMYFIPFSFLEKYFTSHDQTMRANFYKIGNSTAHRHFSTWTKLDIEMPDFHRPEFFGEIILSDESL